MQGQGLSEQEIVQNLQGQGLSPLEISQALEQTKIKKAIELVENEMQPSVLESEETLPQEEQTPEYIYPTPQAYSQYQEYQPYNVSAETTTEIAEQIFEEKISKIKKEIGNISELKLMLNKKIENIDERLKKIEEIIDRLQASIIGKIGSYGSSLDEIKQEMGMMQESFSKALNPLIDRTRKTSDNFDEAKEIKPRKSKKSDGFESFLR